MAPFDGRAPSVVAAVLTLLPLGLIVFPLRLWIRSVHSSWGWDDGCMIVALFPFVGLSAVCIAGAFHGIGISETELTDNEVKTALMWFWLYEIFWCLSVVPVKVSIALTIGRLGRVAAGKRPYIVTLYGLVTVLALLTFGGMFYIIFRCTPISYAWNTDIPDGGCQAPEILAGIYYATTAVNILDDWVCALLPIPLLWNAPLTRKAKLSIGFLLSLGVLASISACVRQTYTNALTHSHDRTRGLGDLIIWGYAEIGIGFFVGSLSSLRPLLMRRTITNSISEKDEGEQELYELPGDNPLSTRQDYLVPERPGNMSPVSREIESHLHRYIFEKPG